MKVRLRPHHLLCLLTYIGKGYSPAFIAGLTEIARRVNAGEEVVIVTGPDDICAPLLEDPDAHCHNPGVLIRDANAARDVGALLDRDIRHGLRMVLTPVLVAQMRAAFANQDTRSACARCDWAALCSDIAADGFVGAILQAQDSTAE